MRSLFRNFHMRLRMHAFLRPTHLLDLWTCQVCDLFSATTCILSKRHLEPQHASETVSSSRKSTCWHQPQGCLVVFFWFHHCSKQRSHSSGSSFLRTRSKTSMSPPKFTHVWAIFVGCGFCSRGNDRTWRQRSFTSQGEGCCGLEPR